MGRKIHLEKVPRRIISLVPSQTELLVDLGLEDRLVGVTKFCVHPKGLLQRKTVVGGTKNFRMDVIHSLKPDLIIANKEENYKEGVEQLAELYPVWISDIYDLEDACCMIQSLGILLEREKEADSLISQVREGFNRPFTRKGKAVYLIWQNPIMAVGKNTFITHMLDKAGYVNLVEKPRYPELSEADLVALQPEYLLLSSEPYPFKERHLEAFRKILPHVRVQLVDGEMFSWYGSRLKYASGYFKTLN